MSEIHNNPKVLQRGGPRMPFIVPEYLEEAWMNPEIKKDDVLEMIGPYPETELEDFTVGPLRGKNALGNSPEAVKHHRYSELEAGDQATLF